MILNHLMVRPATSHGIIQLDDSIIKLLVRCGIHIYIFTCYPIYSLAQSTIKNIELPLPNTFIPINLHCRYQRIQTQRFILFPYECCTQTGIPVVSSHKENKLPVGCMQMITLENIDRIYI